MDAGLSGSRCVRRLVRDFHQGDLEGERLACQLVVHVETNGVVGHFHDACGEGRRTARAQVDGLSYRQLIGIGNIRARHLLHERRIVLTICLGGLEADRLRLANLHVAHAVG